MKNIIAAQLCALLFIIGCSSNDPSSVQGISIKNKVWYTYCYYQAKAAREARNANDTNTEFNRLWEQYYPDVWANCHISEDRCSLLIKEKMEDMIDSKDWTDNKYSESDYYILMQQ